MDIKKSKLVPILGYLYLIIPIIIFCIGWLKWYFSALIIVCTIVCGFFIYKKINPIDFVIPKNKREWIIICISLLFLLMIMLISGISNNGGQSDDLYWRNTIFEELVIRKWPTSMTQIVDGQEIKSCLVYYIGYFLPSALFGKMFGLAAGYAFLSIWGFIGLAIVFFLMNSYFKKIRFWPILFFVCFSGLEYFSRTITNPETFSIYLANGNWIEAYFLHLDWFNTGSTLLSITSHTAQLFWVFNQSIPLFVMMSLIIFGNEHKNVILLTSTLVLSSTLSCLGIAVIIIFLFFFKKEEYNKYKFIKGWGNIWDNIKSYILQPSTILAVIFVVFTGLYVMSNGNFASDLDENARTGLWIENPFTNNYTTIMFLWFIFEEIGIFYLFCFKHEKKNPIIYLATIMPLFFLNIHLNETYDIMLKATTPFMFILCFFFINSFDKDLSNKDHIRIFFGVAIFVLGSITAFNEIARNIALSIVLYESNNLMGYGLFSIPLVLFVAIYCMAIFYWALKAKNRKIKIALCSAISALFLVSTTFMLSIVISKGIALPTWNPSCDAWIDLYNAPNFHGSPDSLFFKYFAK